MSAIICISREALLKRVREQNPKVSVLSTEFESVVKSSVIDIFNIESDKIHCEQLDKCVKNFVKPLKRFWRMSKCGIDKCVSKHPDFFKVKILKSMLVQDTSQSVPIVSFAPPISPDLPAQFVPFAPPTPSTPLVPPAPSSFVPNASTSKVSVQKDLFGDSEPPLKKPFIEKSKSQQNRLSCKIRDQFDKEAIMHAAIQNFRENENFDAAYILKKIYADPEIATDLRRKMSPLKTDQADLSGLEGLALMMDHNLAVSAYEGIRKKPQNLPSTYKIQNEKKYCEPNGIVADELDVKVPMQEVTNHTAFRILALPSVILKLRELRELHSDVEIQLIGKYGLDGSRVG